MNLPTKITMVRLMLVPVMVTLMLLDGILSYAGLYAGGVFILAAVTDKIDGSLARKLGQVTTLGKFMDSIADKVLCMVALVLTIYNAPYWLEWMIVLVSINLAREFLISALRQIAASKNVIVAADKLGKLKAIFQYLAIPVLLVAPDLSRLLGISVNYLFITGFALFALSTVFNIIAAVNYLVVNRRVFSEPKKESGNGEKQA